MNALFEEWKAFIENKNQNNLKTTLNRLSYLQKYRQFVETKVYGKKRLSEAYNAIFNKKDLKSVCDSINKSQNPKVDGMDSLIEYISTKQFIKLAIESSYFFSPDLVKERADEIANYICKKEEVDPAFDKDKYDIKYLPARYSSKEDAEDGVHEPVEKEKKYISSFQTHLSVSVLSIKKEQGVKIKNVAETLVEVAMAMPECVN